MNESQASHTTKRSKESPMLLKLIGWLWVWLLAGQLLAARAPEPGGLRIVNALGRGSGRLVIRLDGQPWSHGADEPGLSGPDRILPAGIHHLVGEREGLAPLAITLRVERAAICHLVLFAEWQDGPGRWAMGGQVLAAFGAGETRRLQLLSLSSNPRVGLALGRRDGTWQSIVLERLRPVQLPLDFERGYLPLRTGLRLLPGMPVVPGACHHLILYDDQRGVLRCLSLRQRPWLGGT